MSDGCGESGREHARTNTQRKSGGEDFAQSAAKVAVAQVCEREGFQTFQLSALETLSDVALRYIHNIGKAANCYANLAGRRECNVFDVIQGLEDLSSVQGFSGASDVDHCLANSGTVREIVQYCGEADDVPFAHAIPQFPVVKQRNQTPSFLQADEEPPEEHIPAWLPVFPEPHTYAQLLAHEERAADTIVKIEQKKQRKLDRSLLNLQQQFVHNAVKGLTSEEPVNADKGKQAGESNPFLAAPLQYGEKEVSHVIIPAKISNEAILEDHGDVPNDVIDNRVSVIDTFAPAIDAIQGGLSDSEKGQKKAFLNRRPSVQFKIGIRKKSFCNFSPQNEDYEKISPLFGRESEKDEKKRKAEKILKEPLENTQGFAQM